ncbi:hypothetical protein A2863_02695 [Candidatus Woesebacteria bacterium RIFCSPHIGHO2_01_FULL_38_9b]|uniref:Dephospho-CoA kinase n=1 Tax=Candidatus Woesebacteria bacterium RIFCSPHIGHO2_01_FULL_38_9b TaxID=1802493 RepID=A0A1F7Y0G9_9BACT|nr:MAG: hypothetical protein A2863_02695 [Candidatus Woesebacteria bacterium RIFCSPHIGHO2_01_FULL_38_9b]
MLIIGITGTNGAGKGTVVEYLITRRGFKHFSVRDYLTKELNKQHLKASRPNLIDLANKLRKKNGPNFLAETLYESARKTNRNCIIESLRNPSEVKTLRKKGKFYLFAVDADPKIRYQRIKKRASTTDNSSFAEFIKTERSEMESDKPNEENIHKCIKLADFLFENNASFENLYVKIDDALEQIPEI